MFRTELFGDTSALEMISAAKRDSLSRLPPMIIDSFAGGGGASTGIEQALGRSPDIAINHNAAALALHAANHPATLHLSENIYKVDPLEYVYGRHIGLAWFSPDCKDFSKAKGGKPVERNIRDLAWVIPHWVDRTQQSGGRIDVVMMENVEEFQLWGPLMPGPKGLMPDPERRGQTFQKWCKRLRALGGKIQKRELRGCDYGAPTIRKRLFVIIRFDGVKIVWPKPTHGSPRDRDVIAGRKLPWCIAADCIDWSLPCPSIFDTSADIMAKHGLRSVRPLADATMARVARGMKRYVLDAERPFLVNLTHGARLEGLAEPFNTITGANRGEKAVVAPHLSAFYGPGNGGKDRAASVAEPVRVVTTENRHAVIAPHLTKMYGKSDAQSIADPAHTIGSRSKTGLIAPVLTAAQHGGSVRSVDDPHHTITASNKDQNSVIVPTLVGCGGRAGQSRPRGGGEPLATITAKADGCVAVAYMAQHNNDKRRKGGVNPGRRMDEPVSTLTQSGSHQGVVTPFIARQFGTSTGHAIDQPSATVMADGAGKSQLVTPHLHAYYGSDQDTPETEPFHTITTKPRFGHVEAVLAVPPFTDDQAERAREVAAFMRSFGFWDDREFVTIDIGDQSFVIVDIGMRMLTPRELYNAQGFPRDYKIDGAWQPLQMGHNGGPVWVEFSKSVQVSCVGNSVCPPVARALVAANCGHLAVREAVAA